MKRALLGLLFCLIVFGVLRKVISDRKQSVENVIRWGTLERMEATRSWLGKRYYVIYSDIGTFKVPMFELFVDFNKRLVKPEVCYHGEEIISRTGPVVGLKGWTVGIGFRDQEHMTECFARWFKRS